jgi:hypothetical protein
MPAPSPIDAADVQQILTFIEREAERLRRESPEPEVGRVGVAELRAWLPVLGAPPRVDAADDGGRTFVARPDKHYHINDLLVDKGNRFLDTAYQALLGRSPDPAGRAGFLALLARGHDRVEVIGKLLLSAEGRQHAAVVVGGTRAKVKALLFALPVVGGLLLWLYWLARLPRLAGQLQQVETRLEDEGIR